MESIEKSRLNFESTLESCFKVFSELEKDGELIEKECFAPFRVGQTDFKIEKYDDMFSSTVYDVYTYKKDNYETLYGGPRDNICCFSYSLYAKIGVETRKDGLLNYSISNLLNLVKTCEILEDFMKNRYLSMPYIIVRLFANPNVFIPDEKFKNHSDFKATCGILKRLFEFPFFEFHQIYIPKFSENFFIERERFFRFFSLFDSRLKITVSKDIDSVITQFELENLLLFSNDKDKSLLFYDIYIDTDFCLKENQFRKRIFDDDKVFLKLFDEKIETEENRIFELSCVYVNANPPWLKDYQRIFYDKILNYKIPAGLFVVKNKLLNFEIFKSSLDLVLSNLNRLYSKIYDKKFMENLRITNHQDYDYIITNLKPTENFVITEIGFDEIFLANLFNFVPIDNVVKIKPIKDYYAPRFAYSFETRRANNDKVYSIHPAINEYKTLFKSTDDDALVMYTPTLVGKGSVHEYNINNFFETFFM